ncbi:PLATZ transcription factor family protein [Striga asiatica]|uniref:PLATZ transcription factor family protein n=1 Tax=Striga asiatica TaxID=4170 RepID=A0A5A7P0T9_STRAF|nr:PLATZ transcription factor family protein [Striga asiatica]
MVISDMLESPEVPGWLRGLMGEKFFNACILHEGAKKNEKNVFCLDCCEGICPHCVSDHHSHRLMQIRRNVYQDVLRLVDAVKLIDCDHVQSYTSNSAKVVFLHQRPRARIHRASAPICISCDRNLQKSYLFCSISCKLEHVFRTRSKLSKYLRNCKFLALPEPNQDDGRMTPDSVLEPAGSVRTESYSAGVGGPVDCPALISTATTMEVVRKKRSILSGNRPACKPVSETNRRKGSPHRSPLY